MKQTKITRFIPRFSKVLKNSNLTKFNMYGDFDFSSITNIISLKFITPFINNQIIKLYSKIKSNVFHFNTFKLSESLVHYFAKLKNNFISIIGKPSLTIKINSQFTSTIKIIASKTSQLVAKFYLKTSSDCLKLKSLTVETFNLLCNSFIFIKIKTTANSVAVYFANVKINFLKIKDKSDLSFKEFAKTMSKDRLSLKLSTRGYSILNAKALDNKEKYLTTASATVYKPTILSSIYSDKIETWYTKTIDEIFYGETIK